MMIRHFGRAAASLAALALLLSPAMVMAEEDVAAETAQDPAETAAAPANPNAVPRFIPAASPAQTRTNPYDEEDMPGLEAYGYLDYLTHTWPERMNTEEGRSEAVASTGQWISGLLSGYGYEVCQMTYNHFSYTGTNIMAIKPGESEKIISIGAHYDCVETDGADDNGSGLTVLLELAKHFADVQTPCTLQFVFFDNEEFGGYVGSYHFVDDYLRENGMLDEVLCCINIDSIGGGDRLYAYGGDYTEEGELENEWVYEAACEAAGQLGIDLYTLPEQVEMFETPTRIKGSDQYYFYVAGIPYVYLESSLWCDDDGGGGSRDTRLTCHYQTADERLASTGGQIMHTPFDRFDTINELFPGRLQQHATEVCALVSDLLLTIGPDTPRRMEAQRDARDNEASINGLPAEAEAGLPAVETGGAETEAEAESPEGGSAEALVSQSGAADNSLLGPIQASDLTSEEHAFIRNAFLIVGGVLILIILLLVYLSITARHRRQKRRDRGTRKKKIED